MKFKVGDVVKAKNPQAIQSRCNCVYCTYVKAGKNATIIDIYGNRSYLELKLEGLGVSSGYNIKDFCLAKPQLAEWEI